MIRPFTCLTVAMALGSGLYLYSEKHRTTLLDGRIRAVVMETDRIGDRTSMLRAEWALLNQPDRLQALAAKYLPALQPVAPTQFVQLAELDRKLPPIAPPEQSVVPARPVAPGTPAVPATPSAPVAPPAASALIAEAGGARTAPAHPVAVASAATAGHVVRAVQTASIGPARAAKAAVRLASARLASHPQSAAAIVASVWARRLAARPGSAERYATASDIVRPQAARVGYATPAPILVGAWRPVAPPIGASALGMAHDAMAPPMAAPGR